jgi:hypothetical protein
LAAAEATLASLPEDGHVLVAADLLDAERSAILGLRSSTRRRKTYQP